MTTLVWISENIKLVAGIVVGVGVIGTAMFKSHKAWKGFKEKLDKVFLLPDEVAQLRDAVNDVRSQVYPNGGSSFRDAVTEELALVAGMARVTRNHLDIPMFECNAEGGCIEASPALCRLFGLTREEMLGNGWTIAIESDTERAQTYREWMNSVHNSAPYRDVYIIKNMHTNKRYRLAVTANAIKAPTGKLLRFVGYITNCEEVVKPASRRRAGAGAGAGGETPQ